MMVDDLISVYEFAVCLVCFAVVLRAGLVLLFWLVVLLFVFGVLFCFYYVRCFVVFDFGTRVVG